MNTRSIPHRTILRAVDLSKMTTISSDDLLEASPDQYQEIRRSATKARNNGNVAYVCEKCGFPVYAPREPKTRLPFWKHHKNAPINCPWWTGNPSKIDEISARQFQGAQESVLHLTLKSVIKEILFLDPNTEKDSVKIEEYLIDDEGRRRPDVQATYAGRPIAIEIQLATTQIPIIVGREDFYARNNRSLLWVTWQFDDQVDRSKMRTAFEDIFYSHNKNLFSLDSEVITEAKNRKSFLVRAFWENELTAWKSQIYALSELNWPDSGLPYAVAPPLPWYLDWRQRWLKATTNDGIFWEDRDRLQEELATQFGHSKQEVESLNIQDFAELLNCILSFVTGRPVGSDQKNLIEVINTFLYSKRHHRYASMMKKVLKQTKHGYILHRDSVKSKFENAFQTEQETRHTIVGRLVVQLFQELF